jgi:hypothetical protein
MSGQEQNDFDILDLISILSFLIGIYSLYIALENLYENRTQSAASEELMHQNDVNAANDKQAKYLLDAIYGRLDKQDEQMELILNRLESPEKAGEIS